MPSQQRFASLPDQTSEMVCEEAKEGKEGSRGRAGTSGFTYLVSVSFLRQPISMRDGET